MMKGNEKSESDMQLAHANNAKVREGAHAQSIQEKKDALRAKYLKIRDELPTEYRARESEKIFQQLVESDEFARADAIFTYVSYRSEVDTHALLEYALGSGKRVAAPLCVPRTREMRWHAISSLGELHVGAYGILEPRAQEQTRVNPPCHAEMMHTAHALAIVPGVAFDARGNRLGYGGGYYDKFLSTFAGVSVGLCFRECYAHSPLPTSSHDVAVDRVFC